MTWWDGNFVGYVFDLADEMTAVQENGATSCVGLLAGYGYDDLGRVTALLLPGECGSAPLMPRNDWASQLSFSRRFRGLIQGCREGQRGLSSVASNRFRQCNDPHCNAASAFGRAVWFMR